jgi:nicotinamidase-related amidase
MKQCLLIVDIQNDYFPGGKMELVNSTEASQNAQKALNFFRTKKLPVIHIQHIAIRPNATFFIPDTEGVKIHQNVLPIGNETIIQKNYPNSFRSTNLLEILKKEEITDLVICGMMTHMCIDTTTRAAFDYGFSCTLIHDACATRDLVFNGQNIPSEFVGNSFFAALNGTFAKVIGCDDFLKNVG